MAVVNPFGSEIKNPFKTKEEEEEKVVNPFKDKEVTIFGNTFNIDTGENIPEVKKNTINNPFKIENPFKEPEEEKGIIDVSENP